MFKLLKKIWPFILMVLTGLAYYLGRSAKGGSRENGPAMKYIDQKSKENLAKVNELKEEYKVLEDKKNEKKDYTGATPADNVKSILNMLDDE